MSEGVNDSLCASLDEARRWVEGGGDPAELRQVLVQCQALLNACSTSDLRQLLQLPLEQQDPPVCPPHLVIAEVVAEEVVTREGDGSLESDGIEIESDDDMIDDIGHINHLQLVTLDAIVSTGDELEVLDVVAMTEEPHVIAEHEGTISEGGDGIKYTYQAPPPSCTRAIHYTHYTHYTHYCHTTYTRSTRPVGPSHSSGSTRARTTPSTSAGPTGGRRANHSPSPALARS